jgi:hypothetical protein
VARHETVGGAGKGISRHAAVQFDPQPTNERRKAMVETSLTQNQGPTGSKHDAANRPIASPEPSVAWRLGALALHPFLFAAASVFRLYAANLRVLYFSDVIAALAGALAAALVLFVAFGVVLRNFGAKAAILASATLVAGLFYVEIVDAVNWYAGTGFSPVAALPIMLAALVAVFVAVIWPRIDFAPANAVLNGIALVIFIVPAWHVASNTWSAGGTSRPTPAAFDATPAAAELSAAADPAAANDKPRHVLYVIFDRYGSQPVLADYYGFDNSDLVGFLRENGFYVASSSRANYPMTAPSVASTFHLDYIDFLARDSRSKMNHWHPIYDMLRDHRVGRFLKSRGYRFVQIGGWWGQTQRNPYADESHSFGLTEFNYWYLRKTAVTPILDAVAPRSAYARRLQWDNGQCQRVPRQIEKVKEVGMRSESTFMFAHILVPHDPYAFSPDGRCLSFEEMKARTEPQGYIEQVRYANSLIKDFVAALLATDGPKPIIIIQADEGPIPTRFRTGPQPWPEATADELKAKMGILNAFYFPDGDYRELDQKVSSVNTFRIVFDKYFGTTFKRLPDRSYAFPSLFRIYDFYDITDILRDEAD